MNKRLLFINLLLFLGCSLSMIAQDRRISGKVTSASDGSALPGVTVQIKDKSAKNLVDNKLTIGDASRQ